MVNRALFNSLWTRFVPQADAVNEAGGRAYALKGKHALAQYAATGCLNSTFYATAAQQLDTVRKLCAEVDPAFLAKTAVYAREKGFMKDMPALLLAELASRDGALLEQVFDRVCDNAKMLRNFVQIVRSGATGRRSLGSRPKRLVERWLDRRSDAQVFAASVGNSPSLADIIRMVHPKPATASRRALYAYLIGRPYDVAALPACVAAFEDFKAGRTKVVPDVPFQMLTGLPLDVRAWEEIAKTGGWQMLRMNLNTFQRHHVFEDPKLVRHVAGRLADAAAVRKARAFPYQLMVAHAQAGAVARPLKEALHDAMEVAVENVPQVDGKVFVLVDVSGSTHSPVTGRRKGATTTVRCIDVAALVAAAFLRRNRDAEVIPFHDRVVSCQLEPRDSVLTNANTLARLPSGGTDCAAPLRMLNGRKAKGDLVIFVSDNESWIDSRRYGSRGTAVLEEWEVFRKRNRKARMICIDLQPNATTQAPDRDDILNVGGFSDAVFELIAAFAKGGLRPDHWVGVIEAIQIA